MLAWGECASSSARQRREKEAAEADHAIRQRLVATAIQAQWRARCGRKVLKVQLAFCFFATNSRNHKYWPHPQLLQPEPSHGDIRGEYMQYRS